MDLTHWFIRVGDGENFRNSKYAFWGVKEVFKGMVKKLKRGDILWFLTSKDFGGKLIGMAEYTEYYNTQDEKLIPIHTYTNAEQEWEGETDWCFQLHYINLYDTERQNIEIIIRGPQVIISYETVIRSQEIADLDLEYKAFKRYAEPINIDSEERLLR